MRAHASCMEAGKPYAAHLAANPESGRTAVAFLHLPDSREWLCRLLLRALEDGTVAIERCYGRSAWEPLLARLLGERLAAAGRLPLPEKGNSVPFTWYPPYSDRGTVHVDEERLVCSIHYRSVIPEGWADYSPHFAPVGDPPPGSRVPPFAAEPLPAERPCAGVPLAVAVPF